MWKGAEGLSCGLRAVQCEHLLNIQRSRMTLLASVSTDVGFNAILPQVLIANKTQLPIKFMKTLDPAITDRLNTAAFMCAYLHLLHELTALESL